MKNTKTKCKRTYIISFVSHLSHITCFCGIIPHEMENLFRIKNLILASIFYYSHCQTALDCCCCFCIGGKVSNVVARLTQLSSIIIWFVNEPFFWCFSSCQLQFFLTLVFEQLNIFNISTLQEFTMEFSLIEPILPSFSDLFMSLIRTILRTEDWLCVILSNVVLLCSLEKRLMFCFLCVFYLEFIGFHNSISVVCVVSCMLSCW